MPSRSIRMISNKLLDMRCSLMLPFHMLVHAGPRSATHQLRRSHPPRHLCVLGAPCVESNRSIHLSSVQSKQKPPFYFQSLTKCKFCNPFVLTFMHVMGGCTPSRCILDPSSPIPYSLSPLYSYSCALFCITDNAQLLWNQTVPHSFRRDGGCTPSCFIQDLRSLITDRFHYN